MKMTPEQFVGMVAHNLVWGDIEEDEDGIISFPFIRLDDVMDITFGESACERVYPMIETMAHELDREGEI